MRRLQERGEDHSPFLKMRSVSGRYALAAKMGKGD
jgi:hypothetical protein